MKKILPVILSVMLLFTVSISNAQSLEETLSNLSSSAAKAYVAPVVTAFGSNLNSGWVSKVPEAVKFKFHLNFKIIAAGSFFNDDQKRFDANGKFFFNSTQADAIINNTDGSQFFTVQQRADLKSALMAKDFDVSFTGPTIVGSKNEHLNILFPAQNVQVNGHNFSVNSYTIAVDSAKGLLNNLSILPTPGVQLTVGTVLGTDVAIRYSPKIKLNSDLGDFSLFGIGAIHNPGAFLMKALPIDIAISFFSQSMKIGDIFESKASQFGIYAGKTFGGTFAISPFIGLTTESSKTTVKYDYKSNEVVNGVRVPPIKINFEATGENSTAITIGFNLKLSVININADYKVAKTKTASAGLSFGF